MNGEAITETLLIAYKDLERYCDLVEHKVNKCIARSMFGDIYEAFDTMVKLTNEKIAYCNCKVIIDEALKGMTATELKLRYIKGLTIEQTAEATGQNERTICRKVRSQKERLMLRILNEYKQEFLLQMIQDSPNLKRIYKRACENNKGRKPDGR